MNTKTQNNQDELVDYRMGWLTADCEEDARDLFRVVLEVERDVANKLGANGYIRTTNILEAPSGKEGDCCWASSRGNDSFDVFIFLSEEDFELLKTGFGRNSNDWIIKWNNLGENWISSGLSEQEYIN